MKSSTVYSPSNTDVKQMFNHIAPTYDFLNHFLSAGIDKKWRKKTIALLAPYQPKLILDIATGTGDLSIEALTLNPEHITGIDISENMLQIARKKITEKNLQQKITLLIADSEKLPFPPSSFDTVICSFGIRNFKNLEAGIKEMHRVLKENGIVAILEFSTPKNLLIKYGYLFYFKHILPFLGKIISKSEKAYSYLPNTVMSFPQGDEFINLLQKNGFAIKTYKRLSMGISSVYIAMKN